MPQKKNLVDKLVSRLTESGRKLLDAVRSEAVAQGMSAYLVGGTVRDLLLDRDSLDVDVVIEGDAIALAQSVAAATSARLAKTTAFGTATLKIDAFSLDLATARAETYAKPGALPTVRPSTIDDDLRRRDFTINAMAARIEDGESLDPTGGVTDLRSGLVRTLHDGSFQDDATRIIRAIRYEQRFGFRIEEHTLEMLLRDIPYLDSISGTRLRQELSRTFEEARPDHPLHRMQELGVLQTIHPALSFTVTQADAARLRELRAPAVTWWALLFWNAGPGVGDAARRLALTRTQRTAVEAIPAALRLARRLPIARRSEMARAADELPLPTACALASVTGEEALAQYLRNGRNIRPILRGDDVIELGVLRGPDVALVLEMLRTAKLDGEVMTRTDEEHLVEQFLARERLGLV
jgi:tRNA nucleotidyltransferase (CCA-adding enzyme)